MNKIRTVILHNEQNSSYACLGFLIYSGSKNDKKNGTAHFLEHLLIAPHKTDFASRGFSLNGITDFEYTYFEAVFPNTASNLLYVSEIFSNFLSELFTFYPYESFIKEDIHQEINKHKTENTDLYKFMMATANNVNHLTPLGKHDTVESIFYEDLLAYHRAFYKPQKTFLFYLGDLKANNAKEVLLDNKILKFDLFHQKNNFPQPHLSRLVGNDTTFSTDQKIFRLITRKATSLYTRVIEDLSIVIVSDILQCKYNLNVTISIHRIDRNIGYLRFFSNELIDEKAMTAIRDCVHNDFNFETYRLNYCEVIQKASNSSAVIMNELINHCIFGDDLFDKQNYIKCINRISVHEIKKQLFFWFGVENEKN